TEYSTQSIAELYGNEVAILIDGVTKLSKLDGRTKSEQKMENMRKMFFAMATDIRVIIIKLADRLHNMRTLSFHSSEAKRRAIAQETLDIYTPLANRLGIFQFKWELEDLALKTLEPSKYNRLVQDIASTREKRQEYIEIVSKILQNKLADAGIEAEIYGRPKNFYSIYNKMFRQNKELAEIYDLLALRVIVNDVGNCYGVLGIVHSLWTPMPGRFKDYIALPKQNMYQSIHTTIISPNGEPLEIQIRTQEMHQVAEHGIAAHWQYKEGVTDKNKNTEKLNWLRQMLDWQKEISDADEFMESVKNDLFDDSVYVFTPRGDVVELPRGSVPLDFAYRVHTEVGHKAVGAKVNGRIVTFDTPLCNGDIVEIITSKSGKPSRDWLKLVKTPQSKNRIRSWFRKEQREELIARGREIYEHEIKKYGAEMQPYLKADNICKMAMCHNFANTENFLMALGENHLTIHSVITSIKDEIKYEEPHIVPEVKPFLAHKNTNTMGISVKGVDNLMIRFGHCCNPLPGDDIVGYITKGKGVTVHRRDCISFLHTADPNRCLEVEWDNSLGGKFQAEIEVYSQDRDHLTTDVMNAIAETKSNINSVFGRSAKDGMAHVNVKIEVKSNQQLDFIINKLQKIKGVTRVRRVIHGKGKDKGDSE
ncbi:MAG: bifunctional (p)ppGpp synthetase/guanosine-3',5'-bis(diphosphate) 3'-pyrophosphohydrolase, partial [Clostridiales bacterium]